MATTAPAPSHEEFPALGEADHGHPSDLRFIWIAILLAVLTAIEVALYYVEQEEAIPQRANVVMLLALAAIKFAVVAGTFMHLKYDHPQFKRYFIGGGILAGFCYIAVLAAFGVVPPWAWFGYGGTVIVLLILAGVRNRVFDAAHGDDHDHDEGDHGHDHGEHHGAAAAAH